MFNNLRSEHNWFTRILLLFIVATFCLWGIGDIFRHSGGDGVIAKVGDATISMREFQASVQKQKEQLRAKMGKSFDANMAKKLGLEKMVLEGIINRVAIEQEAKALGISANQEDVLDAISRTPAFLDEEGKFSKEHFLNALQEGNMDERSFIKLAAQEMASSIVLEAVIGDITVPQDLVKAMFHLRGEKRKANVLLLPAGSVKSGTAPKEEDLKAYYDAHSVEFSVPELRAFSYVDITPATIATKADVSDDELKALYEERSEEFHQPERRVVQQVVFEKKEDAEKAEQALASGKTLADVAAKMPVLNKDKLELGEVTRSSVPVAADEVFALKEGEHIKATESPFGWHIIRVTKIIPEGKKPFEDVKTALMEELQAKKSESLVGKQASEFEDLLGGGKSLEEAASALGLKVVAVAPVSKDGTSDSNTKVTLPPHASLLNLVFATAEKEHSRMTQGESGTYFIVRVDAITKEHARPYEEMLPKVKAAVEKAQDAKALEVIAAEIAKGLSAGKSLKELTAGKSVTAQFEPAGAFEYGSNKIEEGKWKDKELPTALVQDLFKLTPNHYTSSYALRDGGYIIAELGQITAAPDMNSKEAEATVAALREELQQAYEKETQNTYVHYLRQKYPVTVKTQYFATQQDTEGDE